MQNVNKAYAILKDPRQKAYFDENGVEADEDCKSEINVIICEIIEGLIKHDPEDIESFLDKLKSDWTNNYETGKRNTLKMKENLEAFKKRILKAPQNDIIDTYIAGKISAIDQNIIMNENNYSDRMIAIDTLLQYEYQKKYKDDWEFSFTAALRPSYY